MLLAALAASVGLGPAPIPLREVAGILLERVGAPLPRSWSETAAAIVVDLRLPRAVLAALVGAGLATAGTVYQGVLRNPLADPYLIGVSAGAALGATVALTAGLGRGPLGLAPVPLVALAGALASTALVYAIARRGDDAPVEDLVLAGVAVSACLSAAVSWIQLAGGESLSRVILWLMGGLAGRGWAHVALAAPMIALGLAVSWRAARDLNAFLLGDDTARTLGIAVPAARRRLIAAAALMASAAVAVAGLIGFVGLIVPHLLRLLVGPDHRRLIPAAALGGAALLVLADLAARLALPGGELPVGILTAVLGAPFFLFVLARERRRYWG